MNDMGAVLCGTLIDGTGGTPKKNVALLIEQGRISGIVDRFAELPVDGRVIDAREATIFPGLMDIHVHLASVVDPQEANTLLAIIGSPPPLLAFHAAKNARAMLEAGFTTVRDLAGYTSFRNIEVVSLRRAIDMSLIVGPRVFAAAWVSQTAGHLDMGLPPTYPRNPSDRADGVDEVRKLTRSVIRDGVDLIKTSSAGGGGGYLEEKWWRNYTIEELSAIADEAHAVGKKLAVHTHTAFGAKNALIAGADTIEHGTQLDDEAIQMLLDRAAFLVPTLAVRSERALAGRERGGAHAHVLKKQREALQAGGESFRKAYEAGVKIATGTDTYRALREFWGENAYELELMVEFGMTSMDAMVASTKVAAEALGQEKNLGTLEPGKFADLVVFEGDPISDIKTLQDKGRILGVVKGGQLVVDRGVKFLASEELAAMNKQSAPTS